MIHEQNLTRIMSQRQGEIIVVLYSPKDLGKLLIFSHFTQAKHDKQQNCVLFKAFLLVLKLLKECFTMKRLE